MQYDINRAATVITELSGKIDKYEYPKDEEILPPQLQKLIEEAKFTYSQLRRSFEKQTKTLQEQGKNKLSLTIFR